MEAGRLGGWEAGRQANPWLSAHQFRAQGNRQILLYPRPHEMATVKFRDNFPS